jgi:hypothetical protein
MHVQRRQLALKYWLPMSQVITSLYGSETLQICLSYSVGLSVAKGAKQHMENICK